MLYRFASAGNHAQGVALSAKRLNAKAVIVMPLATPMIKVGGELVGVVRGLGDVSGGCGFLLQGGQLAVDTGSRGGVYG